MLPVEIIAKKRDKKNLSPEEIEYFIQGFSKEQIPDYQMTAFLMATLLNGMTLEETYALTKSMIASGKSLNFLDCDFPTADKHSTGGIGDKTSLILAPLVAACGIGVPMIAGRGLGHTGGTIDKLESIPGFQTQLSFEKFKNQIKKIKVSLMAQTEEICPADKKIYGLRDVTATVESIPLICASIMSKKIAEGAGSLVLDVKFGSGAFMQKAKDAEDLAKKLKGIGLYFKRKVTAFLTNMDQPLGQMVGNSVEIEECLSILKNEANAGLYEDTTELSLVLAAEMILLSKLEKNFLAAYVRAEKTLASGKAYEKFEELILAQGGKIKQLPSPKVFKEIRSTRSGYLQKFYNREIGYAAIELKAGRLKTDDSINPVAGIRVHKKIGDKIEKGDVLFTLMSDSNRFFDTAKKRLEGSVIMGAKKISPPKMILKKV